MNISREAVTNMLTKNDCAFEVDECVVGFQRQFNGQPYAIYYIDISGELPDTVERLTKYQERIVAPRYFSEHKHLQWSNYVYFVVPERDAVEHRIREFIERDRHYARKFILEERELSKSLASIELEPEEKPNTPGILTTWAKILETGNLESAVFCNENLPTRMNRIIEPKPADLPDTRPPAPGEFESHSFLNTIALHKYRRFPARRRFEFGTVNLFHGVNGTGKTSVLEAIELLYCGRNFRNPRVSELAPYKIEAVYKGGDSEVVDENRPLAEIRTRNLAWYGQSEVKSTNLYQSFAFFNFLDADAASRFAHSVSSDELNDDLSKLLAGPDTSKVWKDIERVRDAVDSEIRTSLQPRVLELEEEIEDLVELQTQARNVVKESDSIRKKLEEVLEELGWNKAIDSLDEESIPGHWVGTMTELESIIKQSIGTSSLKTPVSIKSQVTHVENLTKEIRELEERSKELAVLESKLKDTVTEKELTLKLIDKVQEGERVLTSGVLALQSERDSLERRVEALSENLKGFRVHDFDILKEVKRPLKEQIGLASEKEKSAKAHTIQAKLQYDNFCERQETLQNLARELRRVARQMFEEGHSSSECPLCSAVYDTDELYGRIGAVVSDKEMERKATELQAVFSAAVEALEEAQKIKDSTLWLASFCSREGLPKTIQTSEVVEIAMKGNLDLTDGRTRIEELNEKLSRFAELGITPDQWGTIREYCREHGHRLETDHKQAQDLASALLQKLNSQTERLQGLRRQKELKLVEIEETGCEVASISELQIRLRNLREQKTENETILQMLNETQSELPWPHEQPLIEILTRAKRVFSLAVRLQEAVGREKNAELQDRTATQRKEKAEKQHEKVEAQHERFQSAKRILDDIVENYSLPDEMRQALEKIEQRVNRILRLIHAPVEFSGVGESWNTLRRIDGGEAKLTEVSTGQRAAYALSLFLARNSELSKAPPVILMDDPIAHVDDLNCLAFLDFLREIALAGDRQIFFTTASAKLASLFERKFEFLGDEFRRFDLKRPED